MFLGQCAEIPRLSIDFASFINLFNFKCFPKFSSRERKVFTHLLPGPNNVVYLILVFLRACLADCVHIVLISFPVIGLL